MVRLLTFAVCLLTAMCGELWLENRSVQRDEQSMAEAYSGFLAHKAGGKTLADLINQKTLAVFKTPKGIVACAVVKGRE